MTTDRTAAPAAVETLEKLKELLSKATPGEWRAGEVRYAGRVQLIMSDALERGFVAQVEAHFVGNDIDEIRRDADSALIVAAVNALPALIAEIEASRARQGVGLSVEAIERVLDEKLGVDQFAGYANDRFGNVTIDHRIVGIEEAARRIAALQPAPAPGGELRFVVREMPGPDGAVFIECEDAQGRSVNAGEWRTRPDGLCELVVRVLPGEAAPAEAGEMGAFFVGQSVEKFAGEAQYVGVIVAVYRTTKGGVRYVVEVKPQGFQMIATEAMLRPLTPPARRGSASSDGGE